MPTILAAESNLMIMYRIEPGDGTSYRIAVSIISPEQGRDIIRGASDAYVLVVPIAPEGKAYPFLRGTELAWSYIQVKLDLHPITAKLYAAIMPVLTNMAPPDEILAAAVAHVDEFMEGGS